MWNDDDYTEKRFYTWGKDQKGREELQAIVAQWRLHIRLGKLAAKVLCEYFDSRIHCFDNTQRYHRSGVRPEGLGREELLKLAEWQEQMLGPITKEYTTSGVPLNVYSL